MSAVAAFFFTGSCLRAGSLAVGVFLSGFAVFSGRAASASFGVARFLGAGLLVVTVGAATVAAGSAADVLRLVDLLAFDTFSGASSLGGATLATAFFFEAVPGLWRPS